MVGTVAFRTENDESLDGILSAPLLHSIDQPNNYKHSDDVPVYTSFLQEFYRTKGVCRLLVLSSLTGFGIGSVVGLVPATLADRYAHLYHGFENHGNATISCMDYNHSEDKPLSCHQGSDDAQEAAAFSNLAMNLFTLICNPVVGAMTDVQGRRSGMLLCLFLACVPTVAYFLVLHIPTMDPFWYYASYSLSGVVHFISMMFATMSDLVEINNRASYYGMLMASYYGSFSLAPALAAILKKPEYVAIFSVIVTVCAFMFGLFFVPETRSLLEGCRNEDLEQTGTRPNLVETTDVPTQQKVSLLKWFFYHFSRPFREAAILGSSKSMLLIAIGSFFSATVHASDVTLIIYYIEEYLNVQQKDIATLFLALAVAGIIVQAGLLQPLIRWLGENRLLVVTFCSGTLHNVLYGVAQNKNTLYVGFVASQFTKANVPLLSSLASQHVSAHEQGRVQGALFATNAIANATGPLAMEFVYHWTKHIHPGLMFIYAAFLYLIGTIVVSFIPAKKTERVQHEDGITTFEQRLLDGQQRV